MDTPGPGVLWRTQPKALSNKALTEYYPVRLIGHMECFGTEEHGNNQMEGLSNESVLSLRSYPFSSAKGAPATMAEVAIKRAQLPGASVREKLKAQDDAGVVAAFL